MKRWAFPLFLVAFFAAWTLRATVFYTLDERLDPRLARPLASLAIKALLWVLPAIGYVRFVDGRNPAAALLLTTLPSRSMLPRVALWIAGYSAAVALSLASRPWRPVGEWPLVLLSVALSPLLEEILFRGLVLGELSTRLGFALGNVATSALFVLVHMPYWLSYEGPGRGLPHVSAAIFGLSFFLGWVVRATGSLWPAVVLHVANNFINGIVR